MLPVGLLIILTEPVEGERPVDVSKFVALVFGEVSDCLLILFPITGVTTCDPWRVKTATSVIVVSWV